MPSVSRSQQRLFQVAENAPGKLFKKNKNLLSLSHSTLHEFAAGSEKEKPERVPMKRKNLLGPC